MRKCIECGAEKPPDRFGVYRAKPDGLNRRCKDCVAARGRRYKAQNKEAISARAKVARVVKRAEAEKAREAYRKSPEGAAALSAAAESRRLHERALDRARYAANPDKYRKKFKEYVASDPEGFAARRRVRREGYKANPSYVIAKRMSARMLQAVRRKKAGRSWLECVGYGVDELMAHLERQFLKGMSWENMGEWHIDHIVPVSSFDVRQVGDAEFARAWALTNLRPLWGQDNVRKGATVQSLL